jgi:SpoU rRNA methylase family enzyme
MKEKQKKQDKKQESGLVLLGKNIDKVVLSYTKEKAFEAMREVTGIMQMDQNSIIFWKQLKSFIGVINNNAIKIRENQQLQIQQGAKLDPEKIITIEIIIYFKEMIKGFEKQEKALTELVINIAREQVCQAKSAKCTV